ncbi:hypothetical protein FO519_007907 [Halicephalobus sp. NKZ332]|nr:hypothetical protein FO519_007907 [Halicephalobus sp. NKZ332]
MHRHKSEPKLSVRCDCFDDDLHFYSQSFVRPRGRRQIFEKKEDVAFMKDPVYRPKKTWEPLRNIPYKDYFDPLHKAALNFTCYLNETDGEHGELLKIRPMKLIYHLDDETFSLTEPFSDNSGHMQGRMFHSQKIPRNDKRVGNDYLSWKDIQIGEDIVLFGRTYRIINCDEFTKNFFEDRGIKIKISESVPIDAWNLAKHFMTDKARETEIKKFFQEKEKVAEMTSWNQIPECLVFILAWLDQKTDFYGEKIKRTFRLTIRSSDDSVTMTELTPGFGNQLFLKAEKLPYTTSDGYRRYYRVDNMRPGMWIDVYKRPMYIYDCEGEPTRTFLKQQYGEIQYGDCPIKLLEAGPPSQQIHVLPNELWFRSTNAKYPQFNLLFIYSVISRRIDIYEEGKLKPWTKGRPFLLEIDGGPLREKDFDVGKTIPLFKWDFKLVEASRRTVEYLKARGTTSAT